MRTESSSSRPSIVFLIGVAGSGKTTVGLALAAALEWEFHDADAFHPHANIEKMGRGVPLTDPDREPWLDTLVELVRQLRRSETNAVIACSALKQRYRGRLAVDSTVRFVMLHGPPDLLRDRIRCRDAHFMPPSLLESQLDDLELPGPDALRLDVDAPVDELVERIRAALEV